MQKTQKWQECENIIKDCRSQIECNSEMKYTLTFKLSATSSRKDVAKLDNNSGYGKILQLDERYDTSVIVSNQQQFMSKIIG